jgi:hypothetical protein
MFTILADPVSAGKIESLTRPGGNASGLEGLSAPRFELV